MVSAIADAWALFGVDRSRTRSPALLRLSEALKVAKRSSAGLALLFWPWALRCAGSYADAEAGRAGAARPATTSAAAVAARDRRVGGACMVEPSERVPANLRRVVGVVEGMGAGSSAMLGVVSANLISTWWLS